MERHRINNSDLTHWLGEQWLQYASSFGAHSNKAFAVNPYGEYRVTDKGEVIYAGDDKVEAILKYNDAP